MVAAEQVAPLPAAVAGVVVGGPAAPPDVSHQLPTALLHLLGLRRRQQGLDLLGGRKEEISFVGCYMRWWSLQAAPAAPSQASSLSGLHY